jgi:bifunctional non-homologous end joining protein LigD
MTTKTQPPSTTLFYKQGASDKVYTVRIAPSGNGFVVSFAYGRRGSTLQTGVKTASPVSFDEAKNIFDKLVREKTAKGYTPGEDGTPYQQTDKEDRATGVLPQLLNPIDEAEAEKLIADPAWLAQEKLDGKRILIRRVGDNITGINRQGLLIGLPRSVVECALKLGSMEWLIDGECIGDTFIAFDLLEQTSVDLRTQPYRKRLDALYCMPVIGKYQEIIQFIRTATKTADKRAMLVELRRQNREGIVFKRIAASYTPGRPASGGDQLKLKFTATASCIVARTNGGKRSVALELLDGQRRVGVGNVTIPAKQAIPAAGQIVEVRYLYAHFGGSLYQPVYLGRRDDIAANACTIGQLKFKAGDDTDEV